MKHEISQRRSSNNKNLDSSLYHFFERIIFQVYADFSENVFFHTTVCQNSFWSQSKNKLVIFKISKTKILITVENQIYQLQKISLEHLWSFHIYIYFHLIQISQCIVCPENVWEGMNTLVIFLHLRSLYFTSFWFMHSLVLVFPSYIYKL